MSEKNFYEVLGVEKNATAEEIKKRFIELAKKYHPDVSKEKNAEAKFRSVSEAYETLSNPDKRKLYDQYGSKYTQFEGVRPFDFSEFQRNFFSTFGDIFSGDFWVNLGENIVGSDASYGNTFRSPEG